MYKKMKMKNTQIGMFGLIFSISLLLLLTAVSGAQNWSIQTVDSGIGWGGNSIAVDSAGNPHICYWDPNPSNPNKPYLKYAKWTGSQWDIQIVDSGAVFENSIAVDSDGNPHICYWDLDTGTLKYAKWTGNSWSIQTVDSAGNMYFSLALDSAGNPHISYQSSEMNNTLKYAKWTGSQWDIQIIAWHYSDHAVTFDSSIAVDSAGNPHISYLDHAHALKYAKWTGSQWAIQTVDSGSGLDSIESTSLDLDSAGNPYISYNLINYYSNIGALKYAKLTGNQWAIQTVDSGSGLDSSIALDSDGNPHICYRDLDTGALKYAKWTGNSWSIQTVDSIRTSDINIALDSSGNPHLSYDNLSYNQPLTLKYAKLINTPVGTDVQVTSDPTTITFSTVTKEGDTSITPTTINPTGGSAPNFKLQNYYVNITTTAEYQGNIIICINYTGIISPENIEDTLTLMHRTGTGWNDVTISKDTKNNIICGEVSSLSWFGLASYSGNEDDIPIVALIGALGIILIAGIGIYLVAKRSL